MYIAIDELPKTNITDNLRGMVKSASWRTVFKFSDKLGERLGITAIFASFAGQVAKAWPEFEKEANSGDSLFLKGLAYRRLVETAMANTAMGQLTDGVHLIYMSLNGWCQIAGVATPFQSVAGQCISVLKSSDDLVKGAGNWFVEKSVQNDPLQLVEVYLRSSQQSVAASVSHTLP